MVARRTPMTCWPLALVLLAAASAAGVVTGQEAAHVDHEGQPLPAEALARIGSARFRAGGAAYQVRYSPNSDTIIAAVSRDHEWGSTGAIEVFDATKGTRRWRIPAEVDFSSDLQCDADGKTLHFYSRGVYLLLDLDAGKERRRLKVPYAAHSQGRLAPTAKLLATRQEAGHVSLIDLDTGKEALRVQAGVEKAKVQFTSSGPPLAFAPDGRTLAVVSPVGTVEGFDTATGARRFEIRVPLQRWDDMHFSANGRDLFCTGNCDRGWIVVRDCLARPSLLQLEPDAGNLNMGLAAFTPDGRHIAVGSERAFVALYDLASGKDVRRYTTGGRDNQVAFSRDGRTLLAASYHGAISQWETASGNLLPASAEPRDPVRVDRFADRDKHLCIHTSSPQVVDWRSNRLVQTYTAPPPYADWGCTLSPDGKLLAGARRDQFVVVDAKSGMGIHCLGDEKSPVPDGRITPSGKRMLTYAMDTALSLWDIGAKQPTRVLRPPSYPFLLAVSGDDRLLATGTDRNSDVPDHEVRVWELTTGKLLLRVPPRKGRAHVLAFSDDGQHLAIAMVDSWRDRSVEVAVIDTQTGRQRSVIAAPWYQVACLRFSPDGRTLAATDVADGQLRLWEVATGGERHRFEGHRMPIDTMAFSADGALLAAGSADAPALVWDIYGTRRTKPPLAKPWSVAERRQHWQDLARVDARVGFTAVRRLIANAESAVALIREHVQPAEPINAKPLKRWLIDLDSDDFDTRQAAFTALQRRADRIEAPLREAFTGNIGLEMKRRLQTLMDEIDTPTGDRLARWRALEALEQIATPDAVRVLETLAGGERDARLTREATAVLARVRMR
jgi:WD40 repeat protein